MLKNSSMSRQTTFVVAFLLIILCCAVIFASQASAATVYDTGDTSAEYWTKLGGAYYWHYYDEETNKILLYRGTKLDENNHCQGDVIAEASGEASCFTLAASKDTLFISCIMPYYVKAIGEDGKETSVCLYYSSACKMNLGTMEITAETEFDQSAALYGINGNRIYFVSDSYLKGEYQYSTIESFDLNFENYNCDFASRSEINLLDIYSGRFVIADFSDSTKILVYNKSGDLVKTIKGKSNEDIDTNLIVTSQSGRYLYFGMFKYGKDTISENLEVYDVKTNKISKIHSFNYLYDNVSPSGSSLYYSYGGGNEKNGKVTIMKSDLNGKNGKKIATIKAFNVTGITSKYVYYGKLVQKKDGTTEMYNYRYTISSGKSKKL